LGANPWQAGKKKGGSRGRNFYPLVLPVPIPFEQRKSGKRAVAGWGACPPRCKRTLNNQRQQAID